MVATGISSIPRFSSSSRSAFCRSYPMYAWLMATQTERGVLGCWGSSWVRAIMALLTMPTWGPLPWATTTSQPSSIRSTIALEVIFTAFICSGRVLPRAFPPRAMTIRFFFSIAGLLYQSSFTAAIVSTSQRTPFGRSFTATQERAGFPVKYFA